MPEILSRRDACSLLLLHACVSRKSGGGGSLWSSLARFTCALISKFHRLTGAEGELQLRPLLSAGEWKSREIPGRGTPSRRLSFQWTRWISGGKKTCSLRSFYFFFFLSSHSFQSTIPRTVRESIMLIPFVINCNRERRQCRYMFISVERL